MTFQYTKQEHRLTNDQKMGEGSKKYFWDQKNPGGSKTILWGSKNIPNVENINDFEGAATRYQGFG